MIKKCFCGGEPCEPFWYSPSDGYQMSDGYYEIVCKKCHTTITGKTKEDAINNWNANIDSKREKYLIHAHWIKTDNIEGEPIAPYYKCSACGKAAMFNTANYCSNCGARMSEVK